MGTVGDEKKIESNAKIIKWSNGSYSLAIGEEMFDIQMEPINKTYCFSQFESFSLLKEKVENKMTVKPNFNSTSNHRRFIKRINDQNRNVVGALVSTMDDKKTIAWVDPKSQLKKPLNLEFQNIGEKSQLKKRSIQDVKKVIESDNEEEEELKHA
mmetsp:Transcript_15166/g.14761  ORF Transcript_15166/g.14761 Transcript_15166/m.14761 type:complete len:155 (-) Transcript_15166:215-679(-)